MGLLLDLNRCVGCHACEIACKQENCLPVGTNWIRMVQIGPKKVRGRLEKDFMVSVSGDCDLCRHRLNMGREPACVSNCPTDALRLCDEVEMLKLLKSGNRYQICEVREA